MQFSKILVLTSSNLSFLPSALPEDLCIEVKDPSGLTARYLSENKFDLIIMTVKDMIALSSSEVGIYLAQTPQARILLEPNLEKEIPQLITSLIKNFSSTKPLENPTTNAFELLPEVWVNRTSRRMEVEDRIIAFSETEIKVLDYLAQNKDRLISHEEFINELWDNREVGSN